ncbi:hypothetical protein ADUPG1_009424 [Aduncisulcus paluster]|uniref:Uncharacterized protein n=1 Tax=Aduncisulcus paluster TaxID=2918883 RepID=A0ABQ5KZH6_9EUKA|nr:hypothetical protein ADUPG1_009424 [Aduncisulcus paluster]
MQKNICNFSDIVFKGLNSFAEASLASVHEFHDMKDQFVRCLVDYLQRSCCQHTLDERSIKGDIPFKELSWLAFKQSLHGIIWLSQLSCPSSDDEVTDVTQKHLKSVFCASQNISLRFFGSCLIAPFQFKPCKIGKKACLQRAIGNLRGKFEDRERRERGKSKQFDDAIVKVLERCKNPKDLGFLRWLKARLTKPGKFTYLRKRLEEFELDFSPAPSKRRSSPEDFPLPFIPTEQTCPYKRRSPCISSERYSQSSIVTTPFEDVSDLSVTVEPPFVSGIPVLQCRSPLEYTSSPSSSPLPSGTISPGSNSIRWPQWIPGYKKIPYHSPLPPVIDIPEIFPLPPPGTPLLMFPPPQITDAFIPFRDMNIYPANDLL